MMSKSTWSSCVFEPLVIVEDTELNKSYYAQIDCGHGWCIDVGISGYRDDICIYIMTSDCCEANDGWHKILKPGESVYSCYSVVGCVDGGFEEAVGELTEARRTYYKANFESGVSPVCYNDYMNALWAGPTEAKTLPLVEKAAEVGCEYYVIDAGWYTVHGVDEQDLGMWEPNDALFGEKGLAGIFEKIKKRGMKPGIWMKLESAGGDSEVVKNHPDYILYRHGYPLGNRRVMFDFRKEGTCRHVEKCIKRLYDIGARYIKNDYNANTWTGIDPDGAVSVHEHSEAFNRFIDGIREKFPDLIIENCDSGGLRGDMETLSRFHLLSVSDQEHYFRLPSIVSGECACIPPERCGVWTYPYPVKIDLAGKFVPSPEFVKQFEDGHVTSYCMVSGLMGAMYMSGRRSEYKAHFRRRRYIQAEPRTYGVSTPRISGRHFPA